MWHAATGLTAALALLGCVTPGAAPVKTAAALPMEVPDGYPPKIGGVVATLNGTGQRWDVYDYSIGALDSAAQIRNQQGTVEFRLLGVPAGDPTGDSNRLAVRATMAAKLAEGATRDVVIEIIAGADWDGLRLSSAGQAVELVLDKVEAYPDSIYGRAKGTLSAVLCAATGDPVQVDRTRCQTLTGTFDTGIQFDNL